MNIRVLANILRIIVFREKHPRQFVAMKHVINARTRGVKPTRSGIQFITLRTHKIFV